MEIQKIVHMEVKVLKKEFMYFVKDTSYVVWLWNWNMGRNTLEFYYEKLDNYFPSRPINQGLENDASRQDWKYRRLLLC